MNFLVDAQLPPALARWISSQGHRATHVFDIDLHAAADPVIWEHARKENAVIVSKDEDFVDRSLLSETPVALIWIRKGNSSRLRTAVQKSLCAESHDHRDHRDSRVPACARARRESPHQRGDYETGCGEMRG